jgi:hypothetical protein
LPLNLLAAGCGEINKKLKKSFNFARLFSIYSFMKILK